jgi:hypothetical protein
MAEHSDSSRLPGSRPLKPPTKFRFKCLTPGSNIPCVALRTRARRFASLSVTVPWVLASPFDQSWSLPGTEWALVHRFKEWGEFNRNDRNSRTAVTGGRGTEKDQCTLSGPLASSTALIVIPTLWGP